MSNLGTEFYDITESEGYDGSMNGLSPEEFGIGAPENFNSEPTQLSCDDYIAQWCATQESNCQFVDGKLTVPTSQMQEFAQAYPGCGVSQSDNSLNSSDMDSSTQQGLLDIKSPNFLGGPNVHNVILIVLGLLILASVTRGNILQGIGTAVKDTVK
jgi:hypothetical protein